MESTRPTEPEILKWLLHTAVHAFHIEYYLQRLQVGSEDPDRPHDIVHSGNKFEWPAVEGFALQFRKGGSQLHTDKIMASREFHRQQYHHQKWGQYYPNASEDAMKLGAVDTVCSLLEPRGYQGGCHTFEQILEIASRNPIHKIAWIKLAVREMERIKKPNLELITDFSQIPRQGITAETYDTIMGRINETLTMLKTDQGYKFTTSPKTI
ncbi:MAG TPA: hypothetical protein VJC39_01885 [Candidatus Nanoarchaeia archaeon]|nr:hypothetical protein [Candidatus Nanoarchaeia archaeon]